MRKLNGGRFQSLAQYFGEDTKNFKANEFFGHVQSFCEQFEKVVCL